MEKRESSGLLEHFICLIHKRSISRALGTPSSDTRYHEKLRIGSLQSWGVKGD